MTAQVYVVVDKAANALLVPSAAIKKGGGSNRGKDNEKSGNKKELANTYFDIAKIYQGRCRDQEIGFYSKGIDLFREIGLIEN